MNPKSTGLACNIIPIVKKGDRIKKVLTGTQNRFDTYLMKNSEKEILLDIAIDYDSLKLNLFLTNFRIDPNDPSKDIILERTNNIEEQQFRKFKRNQRRIHGNRDVGHDLNFYGSYLPIVWNHGYEHSQYWTRPQYRGLSSTAAAANGRRGGGGDDHGG